jgi:hypothetical protein
MKPAKFKEKIKNSEPKQKTKKNQKENSESKQKCIHNEQTRVQTTIRDE